MVSKVFSGHSFYHACRYVVNKPGTEVLECEGVRGHDFKVMSNNFIMQQQLRLEKEKTCFHCFLSFYPGEKLSDEKMTNIAKEYLKINNSEILSVIKTGSKNYGTAIQKQSFPEKELRQLHTGIITNTVLLKQPVKKEIIYDYHSRKAIYKAAALFLILCLMSAGWIVTASRQDMYKANDTKYRYLKLQDNEFLNIWLSLTDSLYLMDANLRNTVIAKEDQNKRNLEILQKALKMEKEAKE